MAAERGTSQGTAEKEVILSALNSTSWNRKRAAALLNIAYKTLLYKMQKLAIDSKVGAPPSAGQQLPATKRTMQLEPAYAGAIGSVSSMRANWKDSLGSYKEQSAIKFSSEGELDQAIDQFWVDDELHEMPRAYVGDNTLIVPASALGILNAKGLNFSVTKVLTGSDASDKKVR